MENPLAGGNLVNWIRLCVNNDPPEFKYWGRVLFITILILVLLPVRNLHKLVFRRKIMATQIEEDPIFILGHFRSGGTHFTNTLVQDTRWGYISTAQSLMPEMFLWGKPMRFMLGLFLHKKRPMDNIMVNPSSPEEPEHAICNLIPYGFFQGLCYPRKMMEYFNKSVLFKGPEGEKVRKSWEKTYLDIIKASTFENKGKQLIIKNPPDTARIPFLLKHFPNAKFIFIYRNPYVMFPSIDKFYRSYIIDWTLYEYSLDSLDDNILSIYSQIMGKYRKDKTLIPEGNLVEVRFEDFESNPLIELKKIYDQLSFHGFEESKQKFESYLHSQKDYKKNEYYLSEEQVQKINREWGEDINRWGYNPF